MICVSRKSLAAGSPRPGKSTTSNHSPAALVGLVYAEDEESALAAAIEEHNIRPADQKRLHCPAALIPALRADRVIE